VQDGLHGREGSGFLQSKVQIIVAPSYLVMAEQDKVLTARTAALDNGTVASAILGTTDKLQDDAALLLAITKASATIHLE